MRIQTVLFFLTTLGVTALGVTAAERPHQITDCLDIENGLRRLDCFDSRAREIRALQGKTAKLPETSQRQVESPTVAETRPATKNKATRLFGSKKPKVQETVLQIQARIESVRKSAGGNLIMTLDNGQIWVENESSNRHIKSQQNITISKKRWRYTMQLDSGRRVAVHRTSR